MTSRLRLLLGAPSRAISSHPNPHPVSTRPPTLPILTPRPPQRRHYAAPRTADAILEDLQELYATAKDEFEIAHEETLSSTIYAASDRAAARAELEKLKTAFAEAVANSAPEVGAEVRRRVGPRVRELEGAVGGMEEGVAEKGE